MEKISITYRSWDQGIAPRPIKLQIPGWSGDKNDHKDGDIPQPWHCTPFVEGATYGLELLYPFESDLHITMVDGNLKFTGDFTEDSKRVPQLPIPPFSIFAPGHFGMSSCLDIKVPEGYVLRTEPHPRFYTDHTNTVPCCIPGHLNTAWWPKIFFIVFKNPLPSQTLIFRKNEPMCQILIVPQKASYDIQPMSAQEAHHRNFRDDTLGKYANKISTRNWHDYANHLFDDKYKVLNNIFLKKGVDGVDKFFESIDAEALQPKPMKFKTRFIARKKYEGL